MVVYPSHFDYEVLNYGTNLHLADTDHDGIADRYELQNLSMLDIPQGGWAAILHAQVWATLQKLGSAVVNGLNLIVNYIMNTYYRFRGDRFIRSFAFVTTMVAIALSFGSLYMGV